MSFVYLIIDQVDFLSSSVLHVCTMWLELFMVVDYHSLVYVSATFRQLTCTTIIQMVR